MEYELLIREAEVEDAQVLLALLDQIGQESTFTSLDENGISISQSEMEMFIDKQAQSDNQITLLAFLNDELAGVINITADHRPRIRHIGDIFLGIKKLRNIDKSTFLNLHNNIKCPLQGSNL